MATPAPHQDPHDEKLSVGPRKEWAAGVPGITHALQAVRPVGWDGSIAATRKYVTVPEGRPLSMYFTTGQNTAALVAAVATSVPCCTTKPCRASPFGHESFCPDEPATRRAVA